MKALLLIAVFLFSLAYAGPVFASDTFRCGPEIVTRGETTVETVYACAKACFLLVLNKFNYIKSI